MHPSLIPPLAAAAAGPPPRSHAALLAALAASFASLSLFACAAPERAAPEPAAQAGQSEVDQTVQSILRLKDPAQRLDDPLVLARLEAVARARIGVVREMAAHAFVVRVYVRRGDTYEAVLQRLRADPAVAWIEKDEMVKIHSR